MTGRLLEAAAAFSELATAARRAADELHAFQDALLDALADAYLQEHDRLPGSTRTRRLRKKRATRLARWSERQT